MKLIMHIHWFMLTHECHRQALKVSTLGFQACLYTMFHILNHILVWSLESYYWCSFTSSSWYTCGFSGLHTQVYCEFTYTLQAEPYVIHEPYKTKDSLMMFINKCLKLSIIWYTLFTIFLSNHEWLGCNGHEYAFLLACWLGHDSLQWQST